ncbi:MAG TPA: hypothetical protein VFT67_02345 [Jatrophihabitantaceae bacterium]|nr:hypothetical protein [Jatrophihabitantaceae bacterium]
MNTLRDLHEAFHELELRADAVAAATEPLARPSRPARRLLAPAASVAAVAAVALTVAGVTVWHDGSASPAAGGGGPATQPASDLTASSGPLTWQPPASPAQVAATARQLLAGLATVTVTDTGYPVGVTAPDGPDSGAASAGSGAPNAAQPDHSAVPQHDGAAIVGTITADGRRGGFDLNVMSADDGPVTRSACDFHDGCTVTAQPDGSALVVSVWHSPNQAGGLTYQVESVRPGGADVLLHLSTLTDPKGDSAVNTKRLPLTVQQMTDFVSSDQW